MGIRAVYIAVTNEEMDRLENLSEKKLLKEVEKMEEKENYNKVNIDKMWDSLHFVLTEITASEPIEDNPLSEFVVGVYPILFEDEFVSFSPQEDVQKIAEALKKIDFTTYKASFKPKNLAKNKIYPNIWVDAEDDLFNEIKNSFDELMKFYLKNKHLNIIVSIY
ncbi:protein of unknown function (DUF1877) [Bernardetia litoralis DSM 6794]|uniref:DUF1877 family protein n=1 Tax=Bernardetia litoralis (strain ATCC 23117 / DSM 6794 / NBRC 15988 / NCIMB 1366 / Fx l1 / Sio-4) TaxID=880071 RepID=I4AFR9_BERLS|nr:YfbM family protein [Bernardetia litoralis]AFM02804.1 protein of unknown function (DUF1877) [Bernardetia litoralis DSM 6794]